MVVFVIHVYHNELILSAYVCANTDTGNRHNQLYEASITQLQCVSKNVLSLTGYSFNTHPPIFTVFGTFHQQRFKNRLHI